MNRALQTGYRYRDGRGYKKASHSIDGLCQLRPPKPEAMVRARGFNAMLADAEGISAL